MSESATLTPRSAKVDIFLGLLTPPATAPTSPRHSLQAPSARAARPQALAAAPADWRQLWLESAVSHSQRPLDTIRDAVTAGSLSLEDHPGLPCFIAEHLRQPETLLEPLRALGLDITSRDERGRGVLHGLALNQAAWDAARLTYLIALGADADPRCHRGYTPMHLACGGPAVYGDEATAAWSPDPGHLQGFLEALCRAGTPPTALGGPRSLTFAQVLVAPGDTSYPLLHNVVLLRNLQILWSAPAAAHTQLITGVFAQLARWVAKNPQIRGIASALDGYAASLDQATNFEMSMAHIHHATVAFRDTLMALRPELRPRT